MDTIAEQKSKLYFLEDVFEKMSEDMKNAVINLAQKAKPDQIAKKKCYSYYKYSSNWCDESFNLTLHPNGTCKIYDSYVYDRDNHSDHELYGIYEIKENNVEVDAIYYHHTAGWDTRIYFEQAKAKHYSFTKGNDGQDILLCNSSQFDNCTGGDIIMTGKILDK
jgi:hypothetical protein